MYRLLIAILLLMPSLPSAAQFKFTPVNITGAAETQVRGVNNLGEIVGFYRLATAACIPEVPLNLQVPNCNVRGFKIVNGVLTKLMVPGSISTAIMGVNDYGDLVGYYTKMVTGCTVPMQHGFIWYHQNVVKTIDYPGVTGFCGTDSLWTVPFGINRAGTVVGAVWSTYSAMPSGGFVWKNGTFSVMDLGEPGYCYSCTGVYGIANSGVIVGTAWRSFGLIPMWVGYMKQASDQDFFLRTQDDTWATGVNNTVDIIGYGVYGVGFFAKHIELNEGTNDAKEVVPQLINVMYPGAPSTWPFGMNDQRAIVGTYRDEAGLYHGFMAAPTF